MLKSMRWAVLASLAAAPAGATVVEALSVPEMTTAADVVAIARVLQAQPARVGAVMVTDVELAVERPLKGCGAGESLLVRLPGGAFANGLVGRVAGTPAFAVGEDVVVFARRLPDGLVHGVVGLAQGVYHVERTLKGDGLVRRDRGGLELRAHGTVTPAPRETERRPLAELLAEVRTAVLERAR